MKTTRIAAAVVLAAGIAACGESTSPVLPADASLDGHTLGSGGGTPPATPSADGVAGDTTGRGGHTLGSGG
jgi:hypothetical protein